MKKVWNVKFVVNDRVYEHSDNPFSRTPAFAAAKAADHEGRVWIEHHVTGQRIYESDAEQKYRRSRLRGEIYLRKSAL